VGGRKKPRHRGKNRPKNGRNKLEKISNAIEVEQMFVARGADADLPALIMMKWKLRPLMNENHNSKYSNLNIR